MPPDDRAGLDQALRHARTAAYAPGGFVGQESFMHAGEIVTLARRADIGPGTSVLDLCCGVAGPGRLITGAFGCTYLGLDSSPAAVAVARERAGDVGCRFAVAAVPPVPAGPFDVVLLLETLLAFADKDPLLRSVSEALAPGGRFAFTVEEGAPLTAAERASMPRSDTVWPIHHDDLVTALARVGLRVRWQEDHTASHRTVVDALTAAFLADAPDIAAQVGRRVLDDLVTAHRLWADWLRGGRIRKIAVVAVRER